MKSKHALAVMPKMLLIKRFWRERILCASIGIILIIVWMIWMQVNTQFNLIHQKDYTESIKPFVNNEQVVNVVHCQKPELSPKPLPLVFLASFPGSGNTWVRHLLQEATGILTCGQYSDPYLKTGGFPAEDIISDRCLVLKTHGDPFHDGPVFTKIFEKMMKINKKINRKSKVRKQKSKVSSKVRKLSSNETKVNASAILLVRNPFEAILADFNRNNEVHSNNHTALAPEYLFQTEDWPTHVNKESKGWFRLNNWWIDTTSPVKNVYVLNYSQLKKNLEMEMRLLLKFLNIDVKERHIQCMLKNSEGNFHRKKHIHHRNLYNDTQTKFIQTRLDIFNKVLQERFNVTVEGHVPS